MLKSLVLLLIFAIGGHAWGAPNPDKKPGDSDRAAQNTQPDKRGTQESPLVVTTRSIHSDEETAEEARQEAEQKHFNRWTIGLTLAIAICAFLQVCAIVGQIFVYKGQSKMMASGLRLGLRNARAAQKSAEAALESVTLQKAQMRQWIDLDEWEGHSEHFFPGATRTTYWMTFWITNPTKMPLTLKKVNITVPDGRDVMRSVENDFEISPENGFRVQWPTVIADETVKRLVEGTWAFTLVIDVDFVDAFRDLNRSQFTVGCKCRTTSCETSEYRNRQQTAPQNPN